MSHSYVVPSSLDEFASNAAMLPACVDAVARLLARVMRLRPKLYIHNANMTTELGSSPKPVAGDDGGSICVSCKRRIGDMRVLCTSCRRVAPRLSTGPSIVESLLRSGHPDYAATQRHAEHIKARLELESFVMDAIMLTNTLKGVAQSTTSGNVRIEQNVPVDFSSYLLTESRDASGKIFKAGGVGFALRDAIQTQVLAWLTRCDERVQSVYNVVGSLHDDAAVEETVRTFARFVANRVARVEPSRKPEFLNAAVCTCARETQYTQCKLAAQDEVERDVRTMRLLQRIARDGDRSFVVSMIETGDDIDDVADLLMRPTPELLRTIGPSVAHQLNFDLLLDRIDNASSKEDVVAAFLHWRSDAAVATASVQALERAIEAAHAHRHGANSFLDFTKKATGPENHRTLPPVPWIHGTARWELLPAEMLLTRRIGLGAGAFRIVVLLSFLEKLMGDSDGLPRGIVSCELVGPVAAAELASASVYLDLIVHDMSPLLKGVEYSSAKIDLMCYDTTHMEGEIFNALSEVSLFSLQNITSACCTALPVGQVALQKLQKLTPFYMSRDAGTHPLLAKVALDLAMPLVVHARNRIGAQLFQRFHPLADRLRAHPAVRDWAPHATRLVLTQTALERSSPGTWSVLMQLAHAGQLCRYRPARKELVFDAQQLAMLLRPQ